MKLAIFSHGKESGPNGTKINLLIKIAKAHNYKTVALDYTTCKNASERVKKLRDYIETQNADDILLIGSSMGGYVSTVIACEYKTLGLFLLCPALYMTPEEYTIKTFKPITKHIEIIHGWNDEVVPFKNSITFGQDQKAVVNLIDDNHRLSSSYTFMERRFENFLTLFE